MTRMRVFLFLALFALTAEENSGQVFLRSKSLADLVLEINAHVLSLPETDEVLQSNLNRIDTIYSFAVKQSGIDHSEALLALTFATLTFDKMPVHLPLIEYRVNFPLPFIDTDNFKAKSARIPKIFYFDSPKTKYSDRDKPAHFFGNAFLAFNLNLFNFTKLIGIFIEVFEDNFKVDGTFSVRDIRTNSLGEMFGKLLNKNSDLKPSAIFYLYNYLFQGNAGVSLL